MMLNDRELGEVHGALGAWVDEAEQAEDAIRPPADLIDEVRTVVRALAEERAHRRVM